MSYIRTKDCVYELEGKKVSSSNYINKENSSMGEGVYEIYYYDENMGQYLERDSNGGRSMDCIYESEIINVVDTIEELCDEFVMTHYFKETNYTKCEVLKEDKDLMIKAVILKKQHNKDKELKNEFNIYGAIWTDKGLIYVSKMNDKGELELI